LQGNIRDVATINTRLRDLESRVDVIQTVQNTNTEGRIRQEEDLKQIQINQKEIRDLIQLHIDESIKKK